MFKKRYTLVELFNIFMRGTTKYLLFFYFTIIGIYGFSQTEKQQKIIDSLEIALQKSSFDTVKIDILNNLSNKLSRLDYEKSYKYANQALSLSKKNNYKIGEGRALQVIASYHKRKNNDSLAIIFFKKSLEKRQEAKDSLGMTGVYNNLGLIAFNKGKYQEAVDYYLLALDIKQNIRFNNIKDTTELKNKKTKNKKSIGISYNNIGNVYLLWGKYENALKYYQKAERVFITLNFSQGLSSTTNNMGLIYDNLAQATDTIKMHKALKLFKKGLEINTEINNPFGIMESYNNIGNIYSELADVYKEYLDKDTARNILSEQTKNKYTNIRDIYVNEALNSYNQWHIIAEEKGSKQGVAQALLAKGSLYTNIKDWKNAKKYLLQSLKMLINIDDKYNMAVCYNYLGKAHKETNEFLKAIKYLEQSKEIAVEIGVKKVNLDNYRLLSLVFEKQGNYKNALKYFKNYVAKKDSIFSEESDKVLQEMQTKYETEKKEAKISLLNKDKELQDNQIKQQRLIIWGFVVVVLIISIFAFFLFRLFNQKKKANVLLNKQKSEIEIQKAKIEEIHEEITDSIHYAKRIQSAILPQEEEISKYSHDKFIYFRPRDIVSGDFYWIKEIDNYTVYVAADCTGHGVPGAFMSMLGVTFLNEIVQQRNVNKASLVLDRLRENIIKSLHQTGKEGEQKDGMDLALVAMNNKKSVLEFAGANNPMYLVRKTENLVVNGKKIEPVLSEGEYNLFEIKGDKMPIGIHIKGNIPFINNIVDINKNDRIYIFSDGFPDQFGGPKGKKFKYKPFKKLILSMQNESMQTQESIFNKTILDWRGDLEQIDDIIIIGIEI